MNLKRSILLFPRSLLPALAALILTAAAAFPGSAWAADACRIDQLEGTCGGDASSGVLSEEPESTAPGLVTMEEVNRDLPADAVAEAKALEEEVKSSGVHPVTLQLFHSEKCPHCKEALAWFPELKARFPNLTIEEYEITQSKANLEKFKTRCQEMGVQMRGVPTFFLGREALVGFSQDVTAPQIEKLVARLSKGSAADGAALPGGQPIRPPVHMLMFYEPDGCSHCKDAIEWIPQLEAAYPNLTVEKVPVRGDDAAKARFTETARKFGVEPQGLPAFFLGDDAFFGFYKDKTCAGLIDKVRALSGISGDEACESANEISVPFLGSIRVDRVSLGQLTLVLGLLDSLNPCAIWVLTFLLSLLAHTRNRKKVLLVGGTFVVVSGVVYFAFMAAWLSLFNVIGMHKAITIILGGVAIVMGLINLKELFFFKKGVSLMIPDSAKPKIATRARKILSEQNMLLAFIGTAVLAGFANVVELGCTVGLPAIFTKVLTSRGIGTGMQLAYMALYNVYYVIPLAIIVGIFAWTMGHFRVTEKTGKILKLISGLVMLSLGVIMLVKPELLVLG